MFWRRLRKALRSFSRPRYPTESNNTRRAIPPPLALIASAMVSPTTVDVRPAGASFHPGALPGPRDRDQDHGEGRHPRSGGGHWAVSLFLHMAFGCSSQSGAAPLSKTKYRHARHSRFCRSATRSVSDTLPMRTPHDIRPSVGTRWLRQKFVTDRQVRRRSGERYRASTRSRSCRARLRAPW